MLRVVHEGVVGDINMGDVAIVAAANPISQAAGGWDLAPASANRWVHLTWEVNYAAWLSWFAGHGAGSPQIKGVVAGFIQARPELLLQVPNNEAQSSGAWPSPRSWEALSRTLSAANGDTEVAGELAMGSVGEAAAIEWLAYRDKSDLPDPETLLARPRSWKPPRRGDQVYAILTSVISAVLAKPSKKRWRSGWELIAQSTNSAPDIAAAVADPYLNTGYAKLEGCSDLPRDILTLKPILEAAGMLTL